MPTTAATLQLAVAAHGIGEHRHPAQTRLQHSIQVHASPTSTTPAMPSTMLHHVDGEFVTSQVEGQMETFRVADGQPDRLWKI